MSSSKSKLAGFSLPVPNELRLQVSMNLCMLKLYWNPCTWAGCDFPQNLSLETSVWGRRQLLPLTLSTSTQHCGCDLELYNSC
jgi:hypothetical protein